MPTLSVPATATALVSSRASMLLREHLRAIHVRTDRLFARLLVIQWIAGIGAALWITPRTWVGPLSSVHVHVWTAVGLGGAIISVPLWLAIRHPGEVRTRHAIGICQMLASALLIHLTGGRIETHFHVFGSLALLAFYRDWKVLVSASVIVAVDHFLRGMFLPASVYGVLVVDNWRWLEHAGWVAFEDAFLIRSCFESVREMREIADRRATLEHTNDIVEAMVVERTSQVKESQERYRRLFQDDITGNAVLGRDGRILACNPSLVRMFGFATHEATQGAQVQMLHPEPTAWPQLTARIESDLRLEEFEMEMRRVDGVPLTVVATFAMDGDPEAQDCEIRAYYFDITERRRLEKHVLRTQRLESIGTLAGGIAHDLNNALAPIKMGLEILRAKETDAKRLGFLTMIEKSTDRGAQMVGQLLSFARGVDGRRRTIRVAEALGDVARIIDDTFLKSIQVQLRLESALWPITADATQLHQVLLNLCVNARDAMPEGGIITLAGRNVTLDARYVAQNPDATVGSYVVISVEDTGTGIAPELLDKIFDPFFTTKEVGKGTGLGLSTSLGIVRNHGGFIRVYSEPGSGTSFQIYLPATPSVEAAEQLATRSGPPLGAGETVLVVDDEEVVRVITQQTLEEHGYRVLCAANGAEAMALFTEHRDSIAVVLTDMMMPVMDGPATIAALRALDSDVRILAASGLHQEDKVARARAAGVTHFLSKPYSAETLLTTLHEVLNAGAPATAQ